MLSPCQFLYFLLFISLESPVHSPCPPGDGLFGAFIATVVAVRLALFGLLHTFGLFLFIYQRSQ
jgi:hypothetical protein